MIKLANIKAPVKQTIRKKRQNKEEQTILQIMEWISIVYPDLNNLVKCNYDNFKVRNKGILEKLIKMRIIVAGYPDLTIHKPKKAPNGRVYHGLFIEIKHDEVKLLNKKLEPATPHLKQQNAMLNRFCNEGYYACFGVGFEHTKEIIKKYMSWEQI